MSRITISNLHPAGCDLFFDSESYLKELSEDDLDIQGGIWPVLAMEIGTAGAFVLTSAGIAIGVGVGYAITKYRTTI